jgi:hypothetical protein
MNPDKNISVDICPKCSQQTFVRTSKKYATEQWCDNCGYFMPKYHECCNDPDVGNVIFNNKDNSKHIRKQCFNCGGKIGITPILNSNKIDKSKLPGFNETLALKRIEELSDIKKEYENFIDTNKARFYNKRYLPYLSSDKWADLRIKILTRDNFKCECGQQATQVHHLTYARLEDERDEDLVSVCRPCHLKKHGLSTNSS